MICILKVIHYFWLMCFTIYHLDPAKFLSAPGLAWQAALKRTDVKLELLIGIDMLLMVEKGIRGGIYHAIHKYATVNNKYMKDYDKNKESSYLKYWDVNNLYGLAMSQKLPVNNFKWIEDNSQFNKDFIKNYNQENDEVYFPKVDIQYPEKVRELHNDLPLLPERIKVEKVEKLVTNLHDKTEYVIHIILKKVHEVIKFNQKAWQQKEEEII